MLKEFVEYLQDQKREKVISLGKSSYIDPYYKKVPQATRQTVETSTLTSVVDFIKLKITKLDIAPFFVHVGDYKTVSIVTDTNTDGQRELLLQATYDFFGFPFGQYQETEDFIIATMGAFKDNEDKLSVLDYAANIAKSEEDAVEDDGVSQKVKLKRGIINLEQRTIKNPVILKPYVTFQEIEPPAIPYIFRIDHYKNCALFKSQNREWQLECVDNIVQFLKVNLPEDIRVIY